MNKGRPAVVARLLAAGADVNPVNPPRAGIPLHQAVSQQGSAIAMFIYAATSETFVAQMLNLDLLDGISFTKGCYIGQEIIARIKYRGHVAKKLTGVLMEQDVAVASGAKIFLDDQKEIGSITSATTSPHLKQTIALAYVKYDYLEPGTKVKIISAEQEYLAQIAELPFVRGSWYD